MQSFFKSKHDDSLYNYFEVMIKLVSLMCDDRNYKGIQPLANIYELEFSIDCFLNENIPHILRSYLARILISVHIDKDPLEVINLPILTRIWQDVALAKTSLQQSKAPIPIQLLKLQDFAISYFTSLNGNQRSYQREINILTLEVLNILEKMILLGFYQNENDLIKILNPVISLLDGSNDFTSKEEEELQLDWVRRRDEGVLKQHEIYKRDNTLRYKNTATNEIMFAIKKKIIQILSKIIDFQNDIRLTRFLIEYYKADNSLMLNPTVAGPELYFLQNVLTGSTTEDDEEQKLKCDEKVLSWMKIAFLNKNLDMKTKSEKDIICILLDIILYQDSFIVNSAFTLLAKYFQQKRAIIQYASQVQILQDDQEVAIFKNVQTEVIQLKRQAEESEFWMGNPEKDYLKKARQFIRKLEMMTELCVYNPERVIDTDDKKKKEGDEEADEEEADNNGDQFEFLNLTELLAEWDNEDPKICEDDQKNDYKN